MNDEARVDLVDKLLAAVPRPGAGARQLVDTLVDARIALAELRRLCEAGALTGDGARSVPSLAKVVLAILRELDITHVPEPKRSLFPNIRPKT